MSYVASFVINMNLKQIPEQKAAFSKKNIFIRIKYGPI